MATKHVQMALGVAVVTLISGASALAAVRSSSSAKPVNGVGSLNGVACPSAKRCIAVGSGQNNDIFDGKSAAIAATGAIKTWSGKLTNDSMNAVACSSQTSCLAVSDEAIASVKVSSAAMKVTATPTKPTSGILALGAIGCAGARRCYAVGFEGTEASSHAVVVTLSPAGKLLADKKVTGTGIGSIACPSSSLCLISNHSKAGESIDTLKSGKISGAHEVPGDTYVESLGCFKARLCYALGGNAGSAVSETNELFPLNPKTGKPGKKATINNFSGTRISCFSATTCLISGFVGSGSTAKPATVAVVKGKPHSPVLYPVANDVNFHAVACASSTKCYAVGSSSSGGIVEKVKS